MTHSSEQGGRGKHIAEGVEIKTLRRSDREINWLQRFSHRRLLRIGKDLWEKPAFPTPTPQVSKGAMRTRWPMRVKDLSKRK